MNRSMRVFLALPSPWGDAGKVRSCWQHHLPRLAATMISAACRSPGDLSKQSEADLRERPRAGLLRKRLTACNEPGIFAKQNLIQIFCSVISLRTGIDSEAV